MPLSKADALQSAKIEVTQTMIAEIDEFIQRNINLFKKNGYLTIYSSTLSFHPSHETMREIAKIYSALDWDASADVTNDGGCRLLLR